MQNIEASGAESTFLFSPDCNFYPADNFQHTTEWNAINLRAICRHFMCLGADGSWGCFSLQDGVFQRRVLLGKVLSSSLSILNFVNGLCKLAWCGNTAIILLLCYLRKIQLVFFPSRADGRVSKMYPKEPQIPVEQLVHLVPLCRALGSKTTLLMQVWTFLKLNQLS